MDKAEITLGDFTIIVKQKENFGKKNLYRKELIEKMDDAYNSGNLKEYFHWYKIYEEQYGIADIIN